MKLTLQSGDWAALGEQAYAIRHEVFVVEQGVPEEIELDEHDPISLHVLALGDGAAVGTGRLLADGHIGRLAVRRVARGTGVGRAMMLRLMELATARGMAEIVLNAQVQAQPFYVSLGFEPEGEVFDEAGIDHIVMRKVLR
ncbi:MAG: GNAT family N-acetyltransferase [Rhodocyclaceae bacterium]